MFKKVLVTTIITSSVSFSLQAKAESETHSGQECVPKVFEMALRFQQKSAEMAALQRQSYQLATSQLKQLLATHNSDKPAAIITDLDETVISNSALLVRDMEACHDYTTWDTWEIWEREGTPTLIPGAKDFLEYVTKQNVAIYYVSDRNDENKDATIATLRSLNLPQVSKEHVRLLGPSKEVRRQNIAKNYDILMKLGDTLHDFSDEFASHSKHTPEQQKALVEKYASHFGTDWIMLPNATYGSWRKSELTPWSKPFSKK